MIGVGIVNHPKMKYTYVGVDSHKDTHTAVLLDCFFDKVGEIVFENLPSKFEAFLSEADALKVEGTTLLFGLEDISAYGRTLTIFLKNNDQEVKHVNSLLVAKERKAQTVTQKNDAIDATCAARVLLSKLSEMPDAEPEDNYWILRTLVMRRDFVVRNNVSLKNHLHSLLMQHYPNYRDFFQNIDGKASLAFFMRYPSPSTLGGTAVEELAEFLHKPSYGHFGIDKAKEILDSLEDTTIPFQDLRDEAVRSTIRQIQFNMQEIDGLESTMADVLSWFETTLTSMNCMDIVSSAQMLSCIGDIKRFPTPAKLARYAGIAPVEYSSGKKDLNFVNKRGNRELNCHFYLLAVRLIATSNTTNRARNLFFWQYYHRKISEGKTKTQALKCVQRRLVNIIWNMLTHGEEYINPPMLEVTKKAND